MKHYVKKPVIIQAIQFTGSNINELLAELPKGNIRSIEGEYFVETNHGIARVQCSDWVILNSSGETYPITNEEFLKNYEIAHI